MNDQEVCAHTRNHIFPILDEGYLGCSPTEISHQDWIICLPYATHTNCSLSLGFIVGVIPLK